MEEITLSLEQRAKLSEEMQPLASTAKDWCYRTRKMAELDPLSYFFPSEVLRLVSSANWVLSSISKHVASINSLLPKPGAGETCAVDGMVRILSFDPPMLHMPLPPIIRQINKQTSYGYRPLLRGALSGNIPKFRLPAGDKLLAMLFVTAPDARQPDLDNYYVKPIIDTLCNAFGLSDCGNALSLALYAETIQPLKTGVYTRFFPADMPVSKATLVRACKEAETLKK